MLHDILRLLPAPRYLLVYFVYNKYFKLLYWSDEGVAIAMNGGEIHVVKVYLDIFPPPRAASVSNGGVCMSGHKR